MAIFRASMTTFLLLLCGSVYGQHMHAVPHTSTHFDTIQHGNHTHTVPHTTTHVDHVWHNGPDYVPHTTTHIDQVWHNGHIDNVPHTTTHLDRVYPNVVSPTVIYPSQNTIYPSQSSIISSPLVQPSNVIPSSSSVISTPPPATLAPDYASGKVVVSGSTSTNVIPGSRRSVVILNPRETGGAIRYSLNKYEYTIRPGEAQTITLDRDWTIAFDNGLGKQVKYRLTEGKFQFSVSPETGWVFARASELSDAPPAPTLAPEAPVAIGNTIPGK